MANPLIVYRGRTAIVPVSLGFDVSADEFTSEIRTQPEVDSDLIATWDVSFDTDGADGELILTLDNSVTGGITEKRGYTDIKRITGGEPVPVFDKPLRVEFRDVVTE